MKFIDLNCDLGEGIGNEASIMPFISSANIACGYHAGDEKTMWNTVELCIKNKVAIGAHPSFLDKENFGRIEKQLDEQEIYELVTQQLVIIDEICNDLDTSFIHVKPHGALYNLSAKDKKVAKIIARAVKDFNHELVLFGLSGSHSVKEAEKLGLKTCSEVFADRSYMDDGSLMPRSQAGALIEDSAKAVHQALQMAVKGTVTTATGKNIKLKAETICLHGDGKHATEFAQAINEALKKEGISISNSLMATSHSL
jgi:UPF0271 protein